MKIAPASNQIIDRIISYFAHGASNSLGAGAEWQATTSILLRAEYLYYDISNANVIAPAPVIPPVAAVPLPLNFNFADYNVQVFRIAGSYKF
jgi:opacity protein-like surface antigen